MQSLRTRRPSGSSSKLQKAPSQSSKPSKDSGSNTDEPKARPRPNARPVNKDARKSRVEDRIKKRMSMRYGDDPSGGGRSRSGGRGGGGDIPDVPPIPGQRSERRKDRDIQEDPRAVDIDILEQENFDPEAYLRLKLTNSTEAELKQLQASLVASKAATATDMQLNIFKNYEEFILISKEISTLENDMLELKESLSEWKSMPSLLRMEDSGSTQDRRRAQRSSVADLRVLYASQMQELHAKIEGSAKFVPAIPGRHVITQTPEIYHLNPATYKVEYTVVLVLLDDSVLIAKRRRRRNGERGKLVAERCWNLSEVLMVDVKDTADRTNIIKLRHGRETHVFRTDRSSEKKAILSSFRQSSEELATKKRKEREGEHERRMSVWTTSGGSRLSEYRFSIGDLGPVPPLPEWSAMMDGSGGKGAVGARDKAEADARWISELSNDLTVAIALQEWKEAVSLVEEGQKQLPSKPALKEKLSQLTSGLISALLHALSNPRLAKNSVAQLSEYLSRLGAPSPARSTFLAARGDLIKKRIRAIPLEGDIPLYIFDLAVIVFTAIKHTAEWYLASYKDNDSVSYLIQWSKDQIENYCSLYRKQLDSTEDDRIWVECNEITRVQSKRLLLDNGLDFNFLLSDLGAPLLGMKSPTRAYPGRATTPRIPSDRERDTNGPGVGRRPLPPRSQNRPSSIVQR